jgi:hypothetical protein
MCGINQQSGDSRIGLRLPRITLSFFSLPRTRARETKKINPPSTNPISAFVTVQAQAGF